jgi:hypothetical protein
MPDEAHPLEQAIVELGEWHNRWRDEPGLNPLMDTVRKAWTGSRPNAATLRAWRSPGFGVLRAVLPTFAATVRDSGPGIAPDRLEWVFDRVASDRSRAAAGTGLGVPIARAIARASARAHGGELRPASPDGAEFTLEIPAAR